MRINGFTGVSLIDYPGHVTSIVYTSPCNFRCPFCHNASLVETNENRLLMGDVIEQIKDRAGFVDAVAITGGEPTLNPGIVDFCAMIKDMKLKVKLDTNGYRPEIIKELIDEGLVDYIAMDVKSSRFKYKMAAGREVDFGKIKSSIGLIMVSGVEYEFRTTAVPGIVEKEDFEEIGKMINGAARFSVQQFENKNTLSNMCANIPPYPDSMLETFASIMKEYAKEVRVLNTAAMA